MLRHVNNLRFGCGLWVLVLLSSAAAAQTSGSDGRSQRGLADLRG